MALPTSPFLENSDSEIIEEDYFIVADKRQEHLELSKCLEFDKQFNFGSFAGLNFVCFSRVPRPL